MELFKRGECVKIQMLTMTFVSIALISALDQCEATKCFKCNQSPLELSRGCEDDNAMIVDCDGPVPCYSLTVRSTDGSVRTEKGCNPGSDCYQDKLGFGGEEGCKEATGTPLVECGSTVTEEDRMEYCACLGDRCNGQKGRFGGKGGGGRNGKSEASSLRWTATGSGLMLASVLTKLLVFFLKPTE